MPTLPELYKQMADLTKPRCEECPTRNPNRCCDASYCMQAKMIAKELGYDLPPDTSHPFLPFMGENGCILEPHQRPTCTMHVCSMNSMGVIYKKTGPGIFDRAIDIECTNQYFKIRNMIDELEDADYQTRNPQA